MLPIICFECVEGIVKLRTTWVRVGGLPQAPASGQPWNGFGACTIKIGSNLQRHVFHGHSFHEVFTVFFLCIITPHSVKSWDWWLRKELCVCCCCSSSIGILQLHPDDSVCLNPFHNTKENPTSFYYMALIWCLPIPYKLKTHLLSNYPKYFQQKFSVKKQILCLSKEWNRIWVFKNSSKLREDQTSFEMLINREGKIRSQRKVSERLEGKRD